MAGKGNTVGRGVAPSPSADVPATKANPPVKAEVQRERGDSGKLNNSLSERLPPDGARMGA